MEYSLRKRVICLISLDNGPHVVVVDGQGLLVLGVRVGGLDLGAQGLVPEELANVGDLCVPGRDGAVALDRGVGVGEQVRVHGAAVVVTREDGLKGHDALGVGELDAAEVGRVEAVGGVVAAGVDAAVDAGGVGVPDVDGYILNGLAGRDVNVLNLEVGVYSFRVQVLLDVGTKVFALDVVGAIGNLGSQNAAGVGAKDVLGRSGRIVGVFTSVVVVDGFPSLEVGKSALILAGSWTRNRLAWF